MKLLYSELQQEGYNNDINLFWQSNRQDLSQSDDFFSLINQQLDRLNTNSKLGYQLLCRLAASRFQEIEWLPDTLVRELLWDIPSDEQTVTVRRLRDASLLQTRQKTYRMHPSIRHCSVARLRNSSEWELANRKIAQYWFHSVEHIQTPVEGLRVLEAYYHAVEIEDYNFAWDVLRRPATAAFPEELFLYFLSWGYIRQVMDLANSLVGRVSPEREASLYRCLGDCHAYLVNDGFEAAIDLHLQAQTIAQRERDLWTEFNSYSDMGLCYIVAGDYEKGLATYQKKLALSQTVDLLQTRRNSSYCEVALLQSYLGQTTEAEASLEVVSQHLRQPLDNVPPWQACWDLNMAGLALKQIEHYQEAQQVIELAIKVAEACNFSSDRARAWYILGDTFREIKIFDSSIYYQQQAIEFFNKVGAKYELAQSYYYLGCTYHDQKKLEMAQQQWVESLKIFRSMKTPKQISKVENSLNFL